MISFFYSQLTSDFLAYHVVYIFKIHSELYQSHHLHEGYHHSLSPGSQKYLLSLILPLTSLVRSSHRS